MKDSFQLSVISFQTKTVGNSPPHPSPLPPWGEGRFKKNSFWFIVFCFFVKNANRYMVFQEGIMEICNIGRLENCFIYHANYNLCPELKALPLSWLNNSCVLTVN